MMETETETWVVVEGKECKWFPTMGKAMAYQRRVAGSGSDPVVVMHRDRYKVWKATTPRD